jgi:purine-binding chemotaxis protein CheW
MTDEGSWLTGELQLDQPSKKRLLRERAIELAQPPADAGMPVAESGFMVFTVAGESYGVEVECVRQVCSAADLVGLPCTPPFLAGILNVRGEVVAMVDLKAFFGIPNEGMIEAREAILISARDMTFGLLADSVTGVRSIPVQAIQPVLSTVAGQRSEYLKGIVTGVMVLDVVRIAADRRLIINEEVEEEVIG